MKTDTETGRRGDAVILRVAVSPSLRVGFHPSSLILHPLSLPVESHLAAQQTRC
jgi:hypothetical protein